jgi:hypothetical protein
MSPKAQATKNDDDKEEKRSIEYALEQQKPRVRELRVWYVFSPVVAF